jgi:hypothetical protein
MSVSVSIRTHTWSHGVASVSKLINITTYIQILKQTCDSCCVARRRTILGTVHRGQLEADGK